MKELWKDLYMSLVLNSCLRSQICSHDGSFYGWPCLSIFLPSKSCATSI